MKKKHHGLPRIFLTEVFKRQTVSMIMNKRLCRKTHLVTFDQRDLSTSISVGFGTLRVEIFAKSYLTSNFWLKFIHCSIQIDINASLASHNAKFLAEKPPARWTETRWLPAVGRHVLRLQGLLGSCNAWCILYFERQTWCRRRLLLCWSAFSCF